VTAPTPAEKTPGPARPNRLSATRKWIIGIVLATVGGFITAQLTGQLNNLWNTAFPAEPITVSVKHRSLCPWVFTSSVPDVQRALDGLTGEWTDNAERIGAIDGKESSVLITVQGTSDKVVELTEMRAVVQKRGQPSGFRSGQCGGVVLVRPFTADLDQPVSTAVPQPGYDTVAGAPTPPQPFPLRVSESDLEVFNLIASTDSCDCTWTIEIDWTVGDRTGTKTVEVDDRGNPFRTIATDRLPFCYINTKNQVVGC
jgi:hypothetical protein